MATFKPLFLDATGFPAEVVNLVFDNSLLSAARTFKFQDLNGTVPLLEAGQTFSGINTFSTVNASYFTGAINATSNFAKISVGESPFDGSTTGFFVGQSQGTYLGFNIPTAFSGYILDFQKDGVSKSVIQANGTYGTISRIGAGTLTPTGLLQISGTNSTAATPSVNGFGLRIDGTLNLTSTSLTGGAITTVAAHSIGAGTVLNVTTALAATNFTTLYIAGAPNAAGTNFTATNVQSFFVNAGASYFGGFVGIGTTAPTTGLTFGATGVGASGLRMFNTSDQITDTERVTMLWNANVFTLFTSNTGAGVIRALSVGQSGNSIIIGGSNAGFELVRNATAITHSTMLNSSSLTSASSVQNMFTVCPTITQTSTAGFRAIYVTPFNATPAGGVYELINLGTNSASNASGTHTSVFRVLATGAAFITGLITATGGISAGNNVTLFAGTTTIAPLTFTSGTLKTSPTAGIMEYDGSAFYLSPSTTRKRIPLYTNATPTAGKILIANGTDFDLSNLYGNAEYNGRTGTDANQVVAAGDFITLPVITAARTVTLTAGTTTGQVLSIWNKNTSGTFLWTFASTVFDAASSTITAIANTAWYFLIWDGTRWVKTN